MPGWHRATWRVSSTFIEKGSPEVIALLVLGVALLGEVAPPPAPPAALSLTVRTPEGVKFSLEVTKEEAERSPEWRRGRTHATTL